MSTTSKVVLRILLIISIVEICIMLFLSALTIELGTLSETLLDTLILASISTPMIYYWVIKPFVVERDNALQRVEKLVFTDSLTGLPNRRLLNQYFDKIIASSVRHQIYGAILVIDLDNFKLINDKYGHQAGDEVLIEISKRIVSATRTEDIVARIGGDEFIILIHQVNPDKDKTIDSTLVVADKVRTLIKEPITVTGMKLKVGSSIGIRLVGLDMVDSKTAIQEADEAMFRAKQGGTNNVVLHDLT